MGTTQFFVSITTIASISFLRALFTYGLAVWRNSVRNTASFLWHAHHDDEPLYRNYFFGPWRYQIKLIYIECRDLIIFEPNLTGISWLQEKIADFELGKIPLIPRFFFIFPVCVVWFLLYLAHFFERFFSAVFTAVLLFAFTVLHFIVATPCTLIGKLIMTFEKGKEIQLRIVQKRTIRCTHCMQESSHSYFRCPNCQKVHKDLSPGKFGIWHTKCACGRILPLTHKDRKFEYEIHEVCEFCGNDLLFATAKNFALQLVGGSSAGKTTFLSAFWHIYLDKLNEQPSNKVKWHLIPPEKFDELEYCYQNGLSDATVERTAITYTVSHEFVERDASLNFSIFDIAGEVFVNSVYDKAQNQYTYCEGIVLLIDPLTSGVLRKHADDDELMGWSQSSPYAVLSSFLENYKNLKNLRQKLIETPISIIITKADVEAVAQRISNDKILQTYTDEQYRFDFSYETARDNLCKEFLFEIDFIDFLQLVDANFKNVHYFLASSIGHILNGKEYVPDGVFESVEWLLSADIKKILADGNLGDYERQPRHEKSELINAREPSPDEFNVEFEEIPLPIDLFETAYPEIDEDISDFKIALIKENSDNTSQNTSDDIQKPPPAPVNRKYVEDYPVFTGEIMEDNNMGLFSKKKKTADPAEIPRPKVNPEDVVLDFVTYVPEPDPMYVSPETKVKNEVAETLENIGEFDFNLLQAQVAPLQALKEESKTSDTSAPRQLPPKDEELKAENVDDFLEKLNNLRDKL